VLARSATVATLTLASLRHVEEIRQETIERIIRAFVFMWASYASASGGREGFMLETARSGTR